jgi:hypothetical protein
MGWRAATHWRKRCDIRGASKGEHRVGHDRQAWFESDADGDADKRRTKAIDALAAWACLSRRTR